MQADTAAPIQSAPQASPTQPISYAAPVQTAATAPTVSTNSQWVAPQQTTVAPAPQMPAQMGVPQNYAPTQYSPQVPQSAPQAENPYKEAFNRVVGLLSSPVQLPFLGQQSGQSQQTVPANYSSPQVPQYNNLGQPISQPGIENNPAYFNGYSQTSQELTRDQLLANGVSEASLEVIDHFGADAPAVLNQYSCKLEDNLIQNNEQLQQAVGLLQELSDEHRAYEKILTDPDVLADYTCEFFGENGPYPIPDEEVGYQQAAPQQFAQAPQAAPEQFVRPQMPVPPQPQPQGNPADFWNSFGSLAEQDPANAWRYLNAAQQNPEVFRSKMLVME
jgi:hypothetical protein